MKAKIQKFDSGMHYFMVDDEVIKGFKKKDIKRVLCQLNGKTEFHCALMPKKGEGTFVNLGKKIIDPLGLSEGDYIDVIFKEDNNRYQFDMPTELQEVLKTDEEADGIFQSLTDGNKRGLIYLVNGVKSIDKRIERALKIAEKLKIGITSPRKVLK